MFQCKLTVIIVKKFRFDASCVMSLRHLVSKNKRRYNEHGFDLDLVYVKPNLITMGYPATSIEASFRNPVKHVLRLFNSAHTEKYWVFNLCSETKRRYHPSIFSNRVSYYGFEDHCPPPINLLVDAVNQALTLYSTCENITLAIHCKAGKGRAGTVAICILLAIAYIQESTAEQGMNDQTNECLLTNILTDYAKTKTYDGKAITIPSQLRSLRCFNSLIQRQLPCQQLSRIYCYPRLLLKALGIMSFPESLRKKSGKNDDLCLHIVCFSGSKEISIQAITNHMELYNVKYSILPDGSVHDKLPGIDHNTDFSTGSASESCRANSSSTLKTIGDLYKEVAVPLSYHTYSDALESIEKDAIPLQVVDMSSSNDDKNMGRENNIDSNSLSTALRGERKRSKSRSGLPMSSRNQQLPSSTVDVYTNALVSVSLDAVLPLTDSILFQDEIVIELTRRNTKQLLGSLRLNSYFLTSDFQFSTLSDNLLTLTISGVELDNISSRSLWSETKLIFVLAPTDS